MNGKRRKKENADSLRSLRKKSFYRAFVENDVAELAAHLRAVLSEHGFMAKDRNKKMFSRFLQWGSITVAIALSTITLLDYRNMYPDTQAQIHNSNPQIKVKDTLGLLTGYGTAVIIMMLGVTSCLLSRNLNVRQKAEAELKKAHSQLEQRVLERTQDLSTANVRLKKEVSDRLQAEEKLLLKQFSLDKTAEAIFWIDPNGRFVDVNQAACDILGYTRDELLELSAPDIDPNLPEEDWTNYWEKLKRNKADIIEAEFKTKEGNVFPVEVATNYVNYNGQEYNFAFAHEITERKRSEDTLRKTNQELREYTRLKNDFIITVSHELRTPLTIFKNIISNILAGVMGPVKRKQQETLETANKEVDRLATIISDFLDISKLEAGKVSLYAREIDIQTVIGDSVDLLNHLASEKNVTLNVDMPKKELLVNADYDKMIQIMKNLLDNAIKFVPDCGGVVAVRVKDLGDRIEIGVEDNGYGIESDDISKVFDRFVQVKKQVGPGSHGTGLGLAISKELIELHGGKIWAENTPQGGANFCFTIPKNLTAQPEQQTTTAI